MKMTLMRYVLTACLVLGGAIDGWTQEFKPPQSIQRPSQRPAAAPTTLDQVTKPPAAAMGQVPERFDPTQDQAFRALDRGRTAEGPRSQIGEVSTAAHAAARLVSGGEDSSAVHLTGGQAQDEPDVPAILSGGARPGQRTAIQNPMSDQAASSPPQRDTPPATATASGWPIERTAQLPAMPQLDPIAPPVVGTEQRSAGAPEPARAAMQVPGPMLMVESYGPASAMINKPATYEVRVSNLGSRNAANILVGVDFPQWVEVDATNASSGQAETSDGSREARVVWTVAGVPAGGHQTLKLSLVPRQPEPFDLALEWTLVPMSAKAAIEVTEPKLAVRIVAPEEILYGQMAPVEVVVENPGTGLAENVSVQLSEQLSGQLVKIGNLPPGQDRKLRIDWPAREEGQLEMAATVTGADDLVDDAEHLILVRRGKLEVDIQTARIHYSGSTGMTQVSIRNVGNADAVDVYAAVALPQGVKFVEGVEQVEVLDGGVRWPVGTLAPGSEQVYRLICQMGGSGDVRVEALARGEGELAASDAMMTRVETIAELALTVEDPRGPVPVGQDVIYTVRITNRGTRAASDVNLVMQFSDGIEPAQAEGLEHELVPGQVLFSPVALIEPGQERVVRVMARAKSIGAHLYRAELTCSQTETRAVAEGTTRFFEEELVRSGSGTSRTADRDATGSPPRR